MVRFSNFAGKRIPCLFTCKVCIVFYGDYVQLACIISDTTIIRFFKLDENVFIDNCGTRDANNYARGYMVRFLNVRCLQ
jgi:hypothetical protein